MSAGCEHNFLDGGLYCPPAEPGETRRVELNVWCTECGEWFSFLGVTVGRGCPHEPTVDEEGRYLQLPIVPMTQPAELGRPCPDRVGS